MEPILWDKILASKLYRFSIGPQKREFTVHSALVEIQSPALNTFVNNTKFKEAGDGHAELEDVEVETFVAFTEYAYTGKYGGADAPALAAPAAPPPRYDAYSRAYTNGAYRTPKVSRLWATFTTAVSAACPADHQPCTNTANKLPGDGCADVRPVLLRHARLYVFADCYGISRLMDLSFYNLGQVLVAFDLVDHNMREIRVEVIVALLRYCYDDPTPELLKSLVVRYAACNAERLWESKSFQELLAAHAELAAALVGLMVERLD
ncbi:hypothetical protein C8A01DRAFT_40192 [Parachaetomium inaequale]|uniref:BTB domain-containing protein n=1 Tax=Parachaetomium inaequale TaxID=2588326 RepID=A0AAN6P7T9_9PEZI|nr:hypothetical protein C8A01DRAFT_40192 [Parachaetomium inaequale]